MTELSKQNKKSLRALLKRQSKVYAEAVYPIMAFFHSNGFKLYHKQAVSIERHFNRTEHYLKFILARKASVTDDYTKRQDHQPKAPKEREINRKREIEKERK